MRAALFLAGLLLSCGGATAQALDTCNDSDPAQVRLKVEVRGMRNTNGNITITIYPDDAAHFLDGKWKVARQTLKVSLPITRACFALPAPGNYAVAMQHDENGNGRFDTTTFGIPAEGWGFSRDPKLFVGPPKLEQVRVALHAGDNPVAVQMKYW
jgi:uncharacterized protein (DUF2141 family)